MAGVEEELVPLGHDLEPVVQAAAHKGDDRAHGGDVLALGLAALEAALDGLTGGHGLGHGEGDGDVDRHAPVGGVLDGLDAHGGGGDLDDDVLGQVGELLGLVGQGLGAAGQARVGLHRQAAVASLVLLEDELEQRGGLDAHLAYDLPADLGLGGLGHLLGQLGDAGEPHVLALVDAGVGDGGVAGGTDATEGDGLAQLVGVGRVVPQGGGRVAGGVEKGSGGVVDAHRFCALFRVHPRRRPCSRGPVAPIEVCSTASVNKMSGQRFLGVVVTPVLG